jgi:hypothetical protein
MPSKAWLNRDIFVLILAVLIFGFCLSVPMLLGITDITEVLAEAIITFSIGLTCLIFAFYATCVVGRRKYRISEEGISILYCGRKEKFFPWNVFRKIVICDFDHSNKYPQICSVIIRLASIDEPYGPHSKKQKHRLSGVETWRGYFYTIRQPNHIIFLEYSPELLDEIAKLSNLGVMFSLTKYGEAKMDAYRNKR